MTENSQPEKQSKLAEVAKFTVVGWGAELVVLLVGFAVMGTAYTFGVHFFLALIVVPIALFAFWKWIQGR